MLASGLCVRRHNPVVRPFNVQVVLNSKHLRGFRKGTNRRCKGDGKKTQDSGGGGGIGRVEYLPIEWHTRFKGRLYQESGAGAKAGNDAAATRSGSRTSYPDAASAPAGASTTACGRSEADSSDGETGAKNGEATVRTSEGLSSGSVPSGNGLERHGTGEAGAREQGGIAADRGDGDGGRGRDGGLSIWDITLPRAPTLRAFTNDTLLDILYFMSPEYHQVGERGLVFQRGARYAGSRVRTCISGCYCWCWSDLCGCLD